MRRVLVLLSLMALTSTGCGSETAEDAGPSTTAQQVTTSTTSVTTTTSTPTTTTVAPTTTSTLPVGCGDAEELDSIERGEEYSMDVDGDGEDDLVTVFFNEGEGPVPNFGLLVEYASGGSARVDRPLYAVRQPLIPIGLHDIEGDGTPEMLVVEYAAEQGISYEPGAFTKMIFLDVSECALTAISGDGNEQFGGTGVQLAHYPPQGIKIRCEADAIVQYDFYQEVEDGAAFSVGVYELRPSGASGAWTRTEDGGPMPKEDMLALPLLDCGELELPPEMPPAS